MIGPVQLLVVGFDEPNFEGQVLAELDKLREHDLVRVIDILLVLKDADGEVSTAAVSDLSQAEGEELGAVAGALIGLGAALGSEDEETAEEAAKMWADGTKLAEEDLLDVVEEIPNDSAVAIALLEHRWAIPLREAILSAGGFPVIDTWVHPKDLVEVGLLAAAEAEAALGESA
jgi:hypothetical protein